MKLIPAKILREQLDSKRTDNRSKTIEKQLTDIAKKIDENKHAGKIHHPTVLPEVENSLIDAGYVVVHNAACGMGDMESITISW